MPKVTLFFPQLGREGGCGSSRLTFECVPGSVLGVVEEIDDDEEEEEEEEEDEAEDEEWNGDTRHDAADRKLMLL